jgi:hypothetical protein
MVLSQFQITSEQGDDTGVGDFGLPNGVREDLLAACFCEGLLTAIMVHFRVVRGMRFCLGYVHERSIPARAISVVLGLFGTALYGFLRRFFGKTKTNPTLPAARYISPGNRGGVCVSESVEKGR